MHHGLGEYDATRPCPNGLTVDTRLPGECKEWRERVERARQWIGQCRQSATRDELAEALTDDDVFQALERINQWAQ
jgi:hypothetical protein